MKFIDTFNEDDKKKLIKKAKLIYSILKKGTITRSDGVKFSYELGDNMVPRVVDGEIELFAFITKIIERTYCPINEIAMSDLIIKKFDQFNIKVDLQIPRYFEMVKYEGKKPWELNESYEIQMYFTPEQKKEEKKSKTVFKALRKGTVKVRHPRKDDEFIVFRYNINDNVSFRWQVAMGKEYINIITNMRNGVTIHTDNGFAFKHLTDKYDSAISDHLKYMITSNIKGRFNSFDVNIHVSEEGMNFVLDEPKEFINENHEEYRQKQIKKGKAVYYALKKGTIGSNDPNEPRFRYTLSDEFSVDTNNLGILIFTDGIKIKELNRECNIVSTGYMQSKIRDRFEQFGIVLTSRHLTSHDIEPWERPMNEEKNYDGNNVTDKDRKKAKLIYDTFKMGKYQVDDLIYRYELPDEYWISKDEEGNPVVVLTMHPEQKMKLYATLIYKSGEKHEVPVDRQYKSLYNEAEGRIEKKFQHFNVDIIF